MNSAHTLVSTADIDAAKTLIASENLRFEDRYDDLVGVFEADKLIGCGARAGRVLKMIVVDLNHRGSNVLDQIVTELIRRDKNVKARGYFVFTRPYAIASFERLNFRLLVQTARAGMLEYRHGLSDFLRSHASLVRSGDNGAVVINSDPFSRGHLHLIETAAAAVDRLYVLVPNEGSFMFSAEVRLDLARRSSQHLNNVTVVDAGPYVLNDATFPGYFLDSEAARNQLRLEMNTELFAQHLAPYFHVVKRFVGAEPLDPAVRSHTQIMQRRLAEHGIRLVEIPREKVGDLWINTQHVRRAISTGDIEKIIDFVPATTYEYLCALPKVPVVRHIGTDGSGGANASNSK